MNDIFFIRNAFIVLLTSLVFFYPYFGNGQSQSEKLSMTLSECIDIALKNNLDIQLKVLDLDLSKEDIKSQKSLFDPYISSQFYYINSVSPNTYVLEEESKLETKTLGKSFSFSQKLPTGTIYDVSM